MNTWLSLRCKLIVNSELEKPGFNFIIVKTGGVEVSEELSPKKLDQVKIALLKFGLELVSSSKKYAYSFLCRAIRGR